MSLETAVRRVASRTAASPWVTGMATLRTDLSEGNSVPRGSASSVAGASGLAVERRFPVLRSLLATLHYESSATKPNKTNQLPRTRKKHQQT
jgi:hypothetical protein